jgi:hypothetical protein
LYSKKTYLSLMHGSSICIATTGLEGSVGWKLGEYVAAAKAIVSEPLRSVQPGDFRPGRNYLEFRTPEQCVDAVQRLVDDPAHRLDMMRKNAAYYAAYVRPDALVWNALNNAVVALARERPLVELPHEQASANILSDPTPAAPPP